MQVERGWSVGTTPLNQTEQRVEMEGPWLRSVSTRPRTSNGRPDLRRVHAGMARFRRGDHAGAMAASEQRRRRSAQRIRSRITHRAYTPLAYYTTVLAHRPAESPRMASIAKHCRRITLMYPIASRRRCDRVWLASRVAGTHVLRTLSKCRRKRLPGSKCRCSRRRQGTLAGPLLNTAPSSHSRYGPSSDRSTARRTQVLRRMTREECFLQLPIRSSVV